MSFANDTRAALAQMFIKKECCELSLLYGLLRFGTAFSPDGIELRTKCREVRDLAAMLLDKFFAVYGAGEREEHLIQNGFSIRLAPRDAAAIFSVFHASQSDPLSELDRVFHCPNCAATFLRGVFLSAGNLSSPDASYHLDLTVWDPAAAPALAAFLEEQGVEPKHTHRAGVDVLYYKGSERIEEFLTLIGANKAVFSLMNEKILREVRNNVNRISNSEVANLRRVADAAGEQLEAIRSLKETGRLARLPKELQTTAKKRLEYPEATLGELAALHEPPLTKSGLNHRLKKLVETAKQ